MQHPLYCIISSRNASKSSDDILDDQNVSARWVPEELVCLLTGRGRCCRELFQTMRCVINCAVYGDKLTSQFNAGQESPRRLFDGCDTGQTRGTGQTNESVGN